MKNIAALSLAALLVAVPASSQDHPPENENDMREGMSLLQEGTRLLLEGLMKEIGPAILELEGKIIDLNAYEMPEVLPNGDIIIRRKEPLMPGPEEGEIDL